MTVSVSVFPNSVIQKMILTGLDPAGIPMITKAAPSQSADLEQWRNSAGVVLAKIRNDGLVAAPYFRNTADDGPYLAMSSTDMIATTNDATKRPFVIRGAASQSADLLQLQNSVGTGLVVVSSAGNLGIGVTNPTNKLQVVGSVFTSGADFELRDAGVMDSTAVRVVSAGGNLYLQSGSADIIHLRNKLGQTGVSIKAGWLNLLKVTAPADADVQPNEVSLWWDNRSASPHLVIKGKDLSGNVRSYVPSRLLGITKYTSGGASAARTTSSVIGMSLTFTMPTLQTGQRVRVEASAYYYNFASAVAAGQFVYNFLYANSISIAEKIEEFPYPGSAIVRFPDIFGFIDNTQIAAGTVVTIEVYSLTNSTIAYQFISTAYVSATVV